LRSGEGGLPEASVINVSQVLTVDRQYLEERLGSLSAMRMAAVDAGLRLVLSL
jgi:mRNA interferase MazF